MNRRGIHRGLFCLGLMSLLFWGTLVRANESTGAAFLKIGIGAKALGMGSAFTSVADDATAIYWNPGGLGLLSRREFSASYAPFIADTKLNSVAYAHPLSIGTIGMVVTRLDAGTFEQRNENRQKMGEAKASNTAAVVSFGRRISPVLGVGVNAKFIQESVGHDSARGMAFDFGVIAKPRTSHFQMALVAQNVGPSMHFVNDSFHLPMSIGAGLSHSTAKMLTFSLDTKYFVYDHRVQVGSGMDFQPFQVISFRAGYSTTRMAGSLSANHKSTGESVDLLSTFAGGIGLHISRYQMDYSFIPMGEFGNTQRVSIGARF